MPPAGKDSPPVRILTIEADEGVRRGIAAFLEDCGYEVLEAKTGGDGLALLHQARPDAVLCDLLLPGMDGVDVLAVATKVSPDTPIIIVSGAHRIGDAMRTLREGAWDYVTKPLSDMGVLESALRRALERARLVRENREYQRRLETLNRSLSCSLLQLRQDEEAGRKVQLRLLPEDRQRHGAYLFRHRQFPSRYLCGDFVDYFTIGDHHSGFYMTDVSGHDTAAALVTVMLKTLMGKYREAFLQEREDTILHPARVLERINHDLTREELDKYCTMFFGLLDHRDNSLRCASAGQYPQPVLIVDNTLRPLASRGRPIGLFERVGCQTQVYALPERFGLVLVSDGILDLLPPYSTRPRAQELLERIPPDLDLEAIVRSFRLPQETPLPDDVTFLLVTREPGDG
jgi:phosphoserine phosphatase RsbU/P